MSSKIKTTKPIPDSFLGNSAKKRKETERAAFSLLDAECKIMYAQLAKLKKVGHKLTTLARFMEQKGSSIMQEQVQQAEYDDLCMKELARLLKVNTSEVLEETKRLVTMSNREQSPYSQAPPQETSAIRNEPHCVQLNRGDFDSVEYHATFDPIAAAEARKEERALAEEVSNANQLPR
ncbi:hypothetical protein ANCDUO_11799 [Ancylostoma duodenale]|uniref:Uncharacterized protein n=1 Tax=Ancylostoma duodenale TaxID=51022 RepID=A0A0C2GAI2_9BILA|nr:hypothetical protein ANCDUO_11799 [Ancylostoma duodenale]